MTIRRQLFDTYRTSGAGNVDTSAVQTPGGPDLTTVQELAELKQSLQDIQSKIHERVTSASLIERVLPETLRTPFTRRITDVRFRPAEKICLLSFAGKFDLTDHITAFNIAMGRTNFSDDEKEAVFCQFFIESLKGPALGWFTGLEENYINSFHDLSAAFLKQYIMFTRQGATLSDLWNLSQTNNQSLCDFMETFKAVVLKITRPRQHRRQHRDDYSLHPFLVPKGSLSKPHQVTSGYYCKFKQLHPNGRRYSSDTKENERDQTSGSESY